VTVDVQPLHEFLQTNWGWAAGLAGAMVLSLPMRKDASGVSLADRTLCELFKGRVCEDVAELTDAEQAQLEFIMLACAGGVTEECLQRGLDVYEVTPGEAARLWRVACEGGNALGCTNLGVLHGKGLGMEPDPAAAARLFAQGCEGGDAGGCTNLGVLHEKGLGMEPDPAAAARLYAQGCEGGDAGGCENLRNLRLGESILRGGHPPDKQRYEEDCEGGDARSCWILGLIHEHGAQVEPDPAEALRLYRKACAMGYADACDWAERLEGD